MALVCILNVFSDKLARLSSAKKYFQLMDSRLYYCTNNYHYQKNISSTRSNNNNVHSKWIHLVHNQEPFYKYNQISYISYLCSDVLLSSSYSSKPSFIVANSAILLKSNQTRHKSTKKSQKRPEYDSDSESDEEVDVPQGTKLITVRLQSFRLDGLLKKALNIPRNKAETSFYEGRIRVNGVTPNKKSVKMTIGDEVDLIKGQSPMNPDHISVSRVEVVSVEEDEDEAELLVKVRVSKTLLIENYPTPWKKSETVE